MSAKKTTQTRNTNRPRKLRRLFRIFLAVTTLGLLSISVAFVLTYRSYARIVDARLEHGYLFSRAGIYAAPRTLRPGQKYSTVTLAEALRSAGYIEASVASEVWSGSFAVNQNGVEIHPHNAVSFPAVVRIEINGERISRLTGDDVLLDSFTLAPESLTNDSMAKSGARTHLSFTDLPPVLVHAITSIEDRRFFDHPGLDIFGVARAMMRNAGDERIGQGGSTITQQLVKNTYLTPEKTFRRKFAEAMLAFTIERRLTKQDIFALYCNEVFLGQRGAVGVRGVHQAARVFFGKELKDLSLAEAATLAGMIQSPSRYSPIRQNELTRARRNTVLGTMVRDGFITLDQAAAAAKEPLTVAEFDPARESVAPYFIDYVNRRASVRSDSDGAAPLITTIDLDLQRIAVDAIRHQLERLDQTYRNRGARPQLALVALDPKTGKVLAMIGGRDYAESQLNRATDALRQPGSVFKPFVYTAALETGMSPLRTFKDAPQEFSYAGNRKYHPNNYGGGFSMRDLPMRDALIKSLNVVTVDVAMQTGLARVANTALKFGLPRPQTYPALALGTTEATPLQIAAAYATFANSGKRIRPRVVADDAAVEDEQVIDPTTAYMITDMLKGVIDHGTARAARGSVKNAAIAGKTGTSRDGWFVGYTPNLVCAIWIGFDDNKQLGLTGAEAALPAWTEFMRNAVDLRPELGGRDFAQPEGITIAEVDPLTDGLATGKCPMHERVALLTAQAPTSECFQHNIYFNLRNDAVASDEPPIARAEPRLPKRQTQQRSQYSMLRETQVATDKVGRKVLVNDMRIAER